MSHQYKGSCLCGTVSFTVNGFNKKAAHCHCSMCRKFHGAAFGTLVGVLDLQWLSGVDMLKDFVAPNGSVRTFCRECGSSIGFRSKGVSFTGIELAIATFDESIPVEVDAHIYTHYQANWCVIQDKLIQFKEGRES